MTEREELTRIIAPELPDVDIDGGVSRGIADAVLNVGYRKPRTITTAEELNALPPGSVLIQEGVRPKNAGACIVIYGDGLVSDRFGIHYAAEALEEWGPLTAIYVPEEQS
ncbi:hypothetical protein K3M35_05195 [Rhodococcus sp. DMU2021]|uniref:hypothetical protein n=1 Tax=Rhodococcus sp. DMU2021 TaxID=2866997 RepID=UPI001C7CC891|nr:hypothetical protein [Rhodococcus sp. DMU2021]MBX4168062.1 hypothetical protein [Rhodococcus sp. DMU2021]